MIEQMQIIGEQIRKLRNQMNCTQEGFALNSGISLTNFRKIEKGTANPTMQTLYLISKELHVPFEDILYPQHNGPKDIQHFYTLISKLPAEKIESIFSLIFLITDIITNNTQPAGQLIIPHEKKFI